MFLDEYIDWNEVLAHILFFGIPTVLVFVIGFLCFIRSSLNPIDFICGVIFRYGKRKRQKLEKEKSRQKAERFIKEEENKITVENDNCRVELNLEYEIIKIFNKYNDKKYVLIKGYIPIGTEKVMNIFYTKFKEDTTYEKCFEFFKNFAKDIREVDINEKKVDVNNCNQNELAKLPGISLAIAMKIVEERTRGGQFVTVEDFFFRAGIKDTYRTRIVPLIEIKPLKKQDFIEQTEVDFKEDERQIDF